MRIKQPALAIKK